MESDLRTSLSSFQKLNLETFLNGRGGADFKDTLYRMNQMWMQEASDDDNIYEIIRNVDTKPIIHLFQLYDVFVHK